MARVRGERSVGPRHILSLNWRHPAQSDWCRVVMTIDQWGSPSASTVRSESRPIWYRRETDGLRALAKPNSIRGDGHCRAAHEKIASDLANAIGFPVPPVVLWDRGQESLFCLSAAAFDAALPLSEFIQQGMVPEDLREALVPYIEWSRAFHWWISDQDRKAAHIMVNLEPRHGDASFAFIDHAFSMSKAWEEEPAADLTLEAMASADGTPYLSGLRRDPSAYKSAAEAIAALSEEQIKNTVLRVPPAFLSDSRKALMVRRLLQRRDALTTTARTAIGH